MKVVRVVIRPLSPVIAPVATKERIATYVEQGWLTKEDAEHLDRAFYRDADGRPCLSPLALRQALKAVNANLAKKVRPLGPLVFERAFVEMRSLRNPKGEQTLEVFECVDGSVEGEQLLAVEDDVSTDDLKAALDLALRTVGLGARRAVGYGRAKVIDVKEVALEA